MAPHQNKRLSSFSQVSHDHGSRNRFQQFGIFFLELGYAGRTLQTFRPKGGLVIVGNFSKLFFRPRSQLKFQELPHRIRQGISDQSKVKPTPPTAIDNLHQKVVFPFLKGKNRTVLVGSHATAGVVFVDHLAIEPTLDAVIAT